MGLVIDIDWDSSVNGAPAAFKTDVLAAVQYLESLFTNPVTLTIDVGYGEIDGQSLGSDDLGESEATQYLPESYASVRNALIAADAPGSSTLPATSPDQGTLLMSIAEATALGLSPNGDALDGYVGFDSAANTFSYANGTTPPSNEYYFIGVVEHEITEDMGRVSLLNEQPHDYSAMDLYRYTSADARDLATGGSGSTAYFSINNGVTNLGTWNNQTSNGDLGDWYPSGPAPGGDDAFNDYSDPGVVNAMSANDVTLMEALGYTVTPTPTPPTFQSPIFVLSSFGSNPSAGWGNQATYPVELGDVTGNGMDDIVGFGAAGVYVSLATGGGNFAQPTLALGDFGADAGWGNQNQYPIELGDVTGSSGEDDIVAFGASGVYVALANGNGIFAQPTLALSAFDADAGWGNQATYPVELGDVTGNGLDDIVGFGASGVYVALATGNGTFQQPILALNAFGADAGWGNQTEYPIELGDVTGSGRDDIVAFGSAGVYVSLAQANGTFSQPTLALSAFGADAGWGNQNLYPIELADVTGNGLDDIVAFGSAGVYVALANGNGTFQQPILVLPNEFGTASGWTSQNIDPRLLGDVTGDGLADILGFGSSGVYESLASTDPPAAAIADPSAPVTVADGATTDLGTPSVAAVTFAGPNGTLQLDQPAGFSGTIAGFGGQDQIDLAGIAFTANTTLGYAANSGNTGGTLSVGNGAATANLSLLGQYMTSSFVATSDGLGGTLVNEAVQAASQTTLLTQPQTTA